MTNYNLSLDDHVSEMLHNYQQSTGRGVADIVCDAMEAAVNTGTIKEVRPFDIRLYGDIPHVALGESLEFDGRNFVNKNEFEEYIAQYACSLDRLEELSRNLHRAIKTKGRHSFFWDSRVWKLTKDPAVTLRTSYVKGDRKIEFSEQLAMDLIEEIERGEFEEAKFIEDASATTPDSVLIEDDSVPPKQHSMEQKLAQMQREAIAAIEMFKS